MAKNLPAKTGNMGSTPGGEDLLEEEMAIHSSILALKSSGWRSLEVYSPWGHESWT